MYNQPQLSTSNGEGIKRKSKDDFEQLFQIQSKNRSLSNNDAKRPMESVGSLGTLPELPIDYLEKRSLSKYQTVHLARNSKTTLDLTGLSDDLTSIDDSDLETKNILSKFQRKPTRGESPPRPPLAMLSRKVLKTGKSKLSPIHNNEPPASPIRTSGRKKPITETHNLRLLSEKPVVPRRRTGIPPFVPPKDSRQKIQVEVADLSSFNLDIIQELVQKLKHEETGVPRFNRLFYIKPYENVFTGRDLITWLQNHLKINRIACHDIARQMIYRNFIHHVTDSVTVYDSDQFFYTFEDYPEDYKNVISKLKKIATSNEENFKIPKKTLDLFLVYNSNSHVLPPIHDYEPNFEAFWRYSKAKKKHWEEKDISGLPSFVPKMVLRHYQKKQKSPIQLPLIEEFFGCVQFVDISGFTPLAEKLSEEGNKGMEKLTSYLNDYFGKLITMITDHGGDVVKFAGDALLAVWPTDKEEELPAMVLLSCQFAFNMQTELHDLTVKEGGVLRVHSGIGVGRLWGLHVGGVNGKIEYLIAGEALDQMGACEGSAAPGEVYISGECWKLARDRLVLTYGDAISYDESLKSIKIGTTKQDGTGRPVLACEMNLILQNISLDEAHHPPNFRLEGIHKTLPLPKILSQSQNQSSPPLYLAPRELLEPYVPNAVIKRLSADGKLSSTIGEFRDVSVIFVNLDLPFKDKSMMDKVQSAMISMQSCVYEYEGTVRQFLFDDKGSVLIACFGMPPFAHEDNQFRAVKTAIKLHNELLRQKINNSIGITSGKVFCGTVGIEARREYAVVGDVVNMSARLMVAAKGRILVDQETYKASSVRQAFKSLDPISVKGKSYPIAIYEPIQEDVTHDHDVTTGLIGCEDELQLMMEVFTQRCKQEEYSLRLSMKYKLRPTKTPLVEKRHRSDSQRAERKKSESRVKKSSSLDPKALTEPENSPTKTRKTSTTKDPETVSTSEPTTPPTKRSDEVKKVKRKRLRTQSVARPVSMMDSSSSTETSSKSTKKKTPGEIRMLTDEYYNQRASMGEMETKKHRRKTDKKDQTPTKEKRDLTESPLPSPVEDKDTDPISISQPTSSSTILVVGNPGTGKTTLIKAFIKKVQSQNSNVLFGSANAIESNTAYYAWREIFRTALGLDSFPKTQADILELLYKILDDEKLRSCIPLINPVLQLEIPENETTSEMSPDVKVESTKELLLALLSRSKFKVIVIDNCSWLDSASWGLALSVVQNLKQILLVMSLRPITGDPAFSSLSNSKHTLHIKMEPLDFEKSVNFMKQRLRVRGLPHEVEDVIRNKSQGIPLLLEELATALIDLEICRIEGGQMHLNNDQEKNLQRVFSDAKPLVALVTTKLDRLEHLELVILQTASVIGVSFPLKLLRLLLKDQDVKLTKHEIIDYLKHLTEINFLQVDKFCYSFSNTFTVEVLYNQMLFKVRTKIHESIAKWYESHHNIEGNETILAHHWKFAEKYENAIRYYDKAGQKAIENFANREAVFLFNEALDLTKKNKDKTSDFTPQEIRQMVFWQRHLGQSYYNLGKFDRATTHLEEALELLKQPLPKDVVGKSVFIPKATKTSSLKDQEALRDTVLVLNCLAKVNFYRCDKKVVTYCNKQALKLASSSSTSLSKELVEIYANCILGASFSKKGFGAIEYMKLGRKEAESTHAPLTQLHLNAGMYYTGIAAWEDAHQSYQRALLSAKLIKDLRRMEEAIIFECATNSLEGKLRMNQVPLLEAFDSATHRGDIQMQVLSLSVQTSDLYYLGMISDFEKKVEEVKYTLRSIDRESYVLDLASKINYYGLKALSCIRSNNLDKSFDSATIALKHIVKMSPTLFFTFPGYSSVIEAFILLIQWLNNIGGKSWKWNTPVSAQKVHSKLAKAMIAFGKFSKYFSFGEARYYLFQGICDHMTEKYDKAAVNFKLSLEAAEKRKTLYDKWLVSYLVGSSNAPYFDEEFKTKLLAEAKVGFRTMEVNSEQILLCISK